MTIIIKINIFTIIAGNCLEKISLTVNSSSSVLVTIPVVLPRKSQK